MSHIPTPAPQEENPVRELLQRWFRDRDREALDLLMQRNMPFLQRYAHGRIGEHLRSKQDTGDVIQDAVIEFLRYSPPFVVDDERKLRGLLAKIVDGVLRGNHRWFAQMRRDVAQERPLPHGTSVRMVPLAAAGTSPSSAAAGHERDAALRLAITTLEPTDQRIVMMRTYRQLGFEEIGAAVDMKADTARVRFRRAVQRLSDKLDAFGQGDFDRFLA